MTPSVHELCRRARRAGYRLERTGAEAWVPASYPTLLTVVDDVLDDAPIRLHAAMQGLSDAREAARSALRRVRAREDRYLAEGQFVQRARHREPDALLFDGPSLYHRGAYGSSIQWGLDDASHAFATESADDYEVLVDIRRRLHHDLLILAQEPPILSFSVAALLESADEAVRTRIPISDLFAPPPRGDGPRLTRYLKTFDTERKIRNRLAELERLFTLAQVRAPERGACPSFDDALDLIATQEAPSLFAECEDEPDRAELSHTKRAYVQLLRANMHHPRYIDPVEDAWPLADWGRDHLPVLVSPLLERIDEASLHGWRSDKALDAALCALRNAPDRQARKALHSHLTERLVSLLGQPAVAVLHLLPDAERATRLLVTNDLAHLSASADPGELITACGADAETEIYTDPEDWACLISGGNRLTLCSSCRASAWPHALQQLSPTPGLDQPSHDALVSVASSVVDDATRDGYWTLPDDGVVVDALARPVAERLEAQFTVQGFSLRDHALAVLDGLPNSYIDHLRRLAVNGANVSPPVHASRDTWAAAQMSSDSRSEMAFWYGTICRRAGVSPVGTPSRTVSRDEIDSLPHRQAPNVRPDQASPEIP